MLFLLRRFEDVLLGVALILPLAGVAVAGLARFRAGRGLTTRQAWARSFAEVGMAVGTVPWLIMGLWPIELPPGVSQLHVWPLTDVAAELSASPGNAIVQIVANLLVFFSLGLLAPVRFAALAGSGRLLALGLASSLLLEISQQAFSTGRVFSVDDILLNGLGCMIGGLVSRRWWTPASASASPEAAGSPGAGDIPEAVVPEFRDPSSR
ncbi:MAG TPA: VanZ family protein [Micromonosporaceae bacterium]